MRRRNEPRRAAAAGAVGSLPIGRSSVGRRGDRNRHGSGLRDLLPDEAIAVVRVRFPDPRRRGARIIGAHRESCDRLRPGPPCRARPGRRTASRIAAPFFFRGRLHRRARGRGRRIPRRGTSANPGRPPTRGAPSGAPDSDAEKQESVPGCDGAVEEPEKNEERPVSPRKRGRSGERRTRRRVRRLRPLPRGRDLRAADPGRDSIPVDRRGADGGVRRGRQPVLRRPLRPAARLRASLVPRRAGGGSRFSARPATGRGVSPAGAAYTRRMGKTAAGRSRRRFGAHAAERRAGRGGRQRHGGARRPPRRCDDPGGSSRGHRGRVVRRDDLGPHSGGS